MIPSMRSPWAPHWRVRLSPLVVLAATLLAGCSQGLSQPPAIPAATVAASDNTDAGEGPYLDPVDDAALQHALGRLAPQRPDQTDLYVVGFAGDASDDVFRNETRYLDQLFQNRFGARDHVVTLINNPDNLTDEPYAPLATYDNLHDTLAAIGQVMDPNQDVLLLFATTHGTEDHTLYVQVSADEEDYITPADLRQALDDAGIRNRVIVLSACYSGGFIPALKTPDTLVITAARSDRPSFGCGNTANATYFGQAWLIDALNRTNDFAKAYTMANSEITARERSEGERPSLPQIWQGSRIGTVLARWREQNHPGAPVAFPYPLAPMSDAAAVKTSAQQVNRE